jgi:hypothetical protein
MDVERLYSAEQISVPPALPTIIKNWTKEVIRTNPSDIIAFSAQYFGKVTGAITDSSDNQSK